MGSLEDEATGATVSRTMRMVSEEPMLTEGFKSNFVAVSSKLTNSMSLAKVSSEEEEGAMDTPPGDRGGVPAILR